MPCALQVDKLSFLPALEVVAGIPTGPSADFTQPFISQLKINGGGPVPGIGAQNAVPSFSSLAMKPTKVGTRGRAALPVLPIEQPLLHPLPASTARDIKYVAPKPGT